MVERRCAVEGCTNCMSNGGVRYCAAHSRARGTSKPATTFHFKCASSNCTFEAVLSAKKRNRVYCDDCAEEREREAARDRHRRRRERAKANAGAQGTAPAHGIEGTPAAGHDAVPDCSGPVGQVCGTQSTAAE